MAASQSQLNYVQSMYIAYYGRAADPGGLDYWTSRLTIEGASGIANAFGNSQEYNDNYGSLGNEDLVNGLFLQLFGRAADPEGLAFYTGWLEQGIATLPDIALRIIDGVVAGTGDDLVVANRVAVANVVTNAASQTALRDTILDDVDGTAASVNSALAALGVSLEDSARFTLTIGESDDKVGIDSSVLLTPLTAESGDILGLDTLRADARFANIDGSGYTVVVLDTGIDLNHPAFGPDNDGNGVSDRIVYHRDFSNDGDGTADDVNGHGSNVSSIIGSSEAAFEGVAPGVNIIALQVLGNDGGGSFEGIQRALQWVVDNHAAFNVVAVNLSLGTSTNSNTPQVDVLADEFAALNSLGIINIAAAGNDYFSFQAPGVGYPASDPNVIAVGATFDADVGSQGWLDGAEAFSTGVDVVVPFSQRSPLLTPVFAPGATITGAAPGGGSAGQTGTSQAAPQIAGVAALAQQIADQELGRRLSPSEFLSLLSSSAVTIVDGDDENDNVLNTGASFKRVDVPALAAAIAALDGDDTPAPAPAGDAIPGDSSTQATLALGVITEGVIDTRGDRDWYRVDLEAGTNYDFSLNRITLTDPWLGLFDPAGTLVASNNDAGGTKNSALSYTPGQSGTFFLSAEGFATADTGTYLIEARESTFGNSDSIPGDSSSETTLAVDSPVSSAIDFGGDRDWLRMELQAGVTYSIDVTGSTSGGGDLDDPTLEIFSTAGVTLAANDDGGAGLEAALVFTPTTSGTFFAGVRAFDAEATGSYTISLAGDDDVDAIPGDNSSVAALAGDGGADSSIDFAGDEDWFVVTLPGGVQAVFELVGSGAGALADPFLTLYDSSGEPLAEDDDSGAGTNARLAFTPESSGTFFIGASAFSSGIGDYSLSRGSSAAGNADIVDGVSIGDAGDSRAGAATIGIDDGDGFVTGSAGFGADSGDFYRFTAAASGLAEFALTDLAGDLDLVLEDDSGQVVIAGSFEGGDSDETFSAIVEAGFSYLLRVDPYGSAASSYTLTLDLPASSTSGRSDVINGSDDLGDAPNTLAGAAPLPAAGSVQVLGSTGFGSDAGDLFALTPAGSGSASFALSELRSDLDIALLSDTGSILASSAAPGSAAEDFDFPLMAGTDYYLWVVPFAGSSEYRLDIQLPAATSGGDDTVNGVAVGDAGNDPQSATAITLDGDGDALITGSSGFGGDPGDFYRFQAAASGFAAFEVSGLSDDLDLEIFAADGNSLVYLPAFGSDSEYLTLDLLAGENYIVGVYPWADARSDYTLSIETEASQAFGDTVNGEDVGDAGPFYDPTPVMADALGAISVLGSVGFGNDDGDAFRFTAAGGDFSSSGAIAVNLSVLDEDVDLDIYLYDTEGRVLAQSANDGDSDEALVAVVEPGEDYIVEVYAYSGAGRYALDVMPTQLSGSPDFVDGINVDDAPNDLEETLDITGYLSALGALVINGSVGFDEDSDDFYTVDALQSGPINLSMFNFEGELDLRLLDSAGAVLAATSPLSYEGEFISFLAEEPGRYIIQVAAQEGEASAYSMLVNFPAPPEEPGDDSINGIPIGDASDSDESPTLAIPETVDSTIVIEGSTGFGDDSGDIYSVVAPGSGEVTVGYELSAPVRVFLSDLFENVLFDDVLAADEAGSFTVDVNFGVLYTLQLTADEGTEYRLELSAPDLLAGQDPLDDYVVGTPDFFGDAGDELEAALPVSISESGDERIFGATGFGDDDADYYLLPSFEAGTASLRLTGLSADLDLAVFDPFGTELASSENEGSAEEFISFGAAAEFAYVVAVTPFGDAESTYELIVDFTPGADPGTGEYVNGLATGGDVGDLFDPLAVFFDGVDQIRIAGSVDPETDIFDAFSFTAEATGPLAVDLYNFAADTDLDVGLFDDDGNELASSRNAEDGAAESLVFDVTAGEQYIVEVLAFEGSPSGYFLDLIG